LVTESVHSDGITVVFLIVLGDEIHVILETGGSQSKQAK
jgi:hypothetical protein